MVGFRGTDEALDHEIETLERIGRVRLRRASDSLREVDRDLRELKREQARRRARAAHPEVVAVPSDATA
ncbi:MAG: hypothetical protein L3J95_02055 [Thermoplasmata archaeon]|nr:hypothetical protein [Thermoplasmata archaeon]MCI4359195.1 hypothetical protein [Thermoplasmata archaeon]